MISIKIYNNAIINEGHSAPSICSEISYGFYILRNLFSYLGFEIKSEAEDNTGSSYMYFEINGTTQTMIKAYYESVALWVKHYYSKEVKVERIKKEVR